MIVLVIKDFIDCRRENFYNFLKWCYFWVVYLSIKWVSLITNYHDREYTYEKASFFVTSSNHAANRQRFWLNRFL